MGPCGLRQFERGGELGAAVDLYGLVRNVPARFITATRRVASPATPAIDNSLRGLRGTAGLRGRAPYVDACGGP